MAEYLTNTTDLTKVASAIREKGGTTAQLVYPDGFVTAIESIEAGGGGNLATGTFTTTDDITSNVVINHNLGVKPKFIIVLSTSSSTYSQSSTRWLCFCYLYQYNSNFYGSKYQSPGESTASYGSDLISKSGNGTTGSLWYKVNVDETTFTLKQAKISSKYGIGASHGFFWLAYGE